MERTGSYGVAALYRSFCVAAAFQLLAGAAACDARDHVPPAHSASPPPPPLGEVGPARWRPGHWNVNDWGPNPGQALAFRGDHVTRVGSDVVLSLDVDGAAQIQSSDAYSQGVATARISLPVIAPGQDAAFFLYGRDTEELDFEFTARGLWLCVHQGGLQYGRFLDARNHGGETVSLQVSWSRQSVEFALDGARVWAVRPGDLPAGMGLPRGPMQAFFSNAAFKDNAFFGRFDGVPKFESRRLLVHGFSLATQ